MPDQPQPTEGMTKLLEGFATLREAASPKVWNPSIYKDQLFPEPLALHKLVRELETATKPQDTLKPLGIRPEEAHRQWQNYLKTRDSNQIERRALRYLCWDLEIAPTPAFLRLTAQQDRPPSASMILGLLGVNHTLWTIPNDTLERLIVKWFHGYEGYNPAVRRLVAIADEVVGRDATWRAARTAFEKRLTAHQLLEERGLTLQSAYASIVAAELLKANVQILERAGDLTRARYICDQLIPTDRDLLKPDTFADAVKRLVAIAVRATGARFQDIVKGFVLLEPRLGDPRRHAARWENAGLSVEAEMIKGWLSEEDLKFFFDLIMESQKDRHERRKFWLRYVSQAKDFCVAIGKADRQRLRTQLQDLKKRGRIYAELDDLYVSAFIMDFGSVIAVDFSVVGACCIYDAKTGRKRIGDLRAKAFQTRKLKAEANYPGRFIHTGLWMHKVQQYLALEYDIRE